MNKSSSRHNGGLGTNSSTGHLPGRPETRVNTAVLRVPVISLDSHGRAHWVLAGPRDIPRYALVILAGPWRPPENSGTQNHESWPHPEGRQPAMGVGSHPCTCFSLGLCLDDGAPGYQIGVGSEQWFLGLGGVIWQWTSSGGIWSPGHSGYLGKHGLTWQFFLCGKGEVEIEMQKE